MMPERSYDVAILQPQCLFGLVPRSRELGISPEEANQRDLDDSRALAFEAHERAASTVAARYGIRARLEFVRFVPDEIREAGVGSAVDAAYDLVRVFVDSGVPVDVLSNLIADFLVEGGKELLALARVREADRTPGRRRVTSEGIEAWCKRHAERLNPGLPVSEPVILKDPSKTSNSRGIYVVTVGVGAKELTYTIGHDGEPYAIVETSPSAIRLVATDDWREWFLAGES